MAHWAFRVNLILVFTFSDYRGRIYMGSNVIPWVIQGQTLPRVIPVTVAIPLISLHPSTPTTPVSEAMIVVVPWWYHGGVAATMMIKIVV